MNLWLMDYHVYVAYETDLSLFIRVGAIKDS